MQNSNIVYMLEVVIHESDSNDYHDHILYMKLFITYQYAFKIMLHIWPRHHSLGKSRVLNMYLQNGYMKRMQKSSIVYMVEVVAQNYESHMA